MLRTEILSRDDGTNLIRTYSDRGFLIQQDQTGALYSEAVDVEGKGYTYTETNQMSDDILTAEQALDILMGGDGDVEINS